MEYTFDNTALDTLPEGFHQTGEFKLKNNTRMMIMLNIAGFGLLLAAALFLERYIILTRRGFSSSILAFEVENLAQVGLFVLYLIIDFLILVILHEGVHGVCFWLITRRRPVFALGPGYAYAAAPGVYIKKNPYLVTAISPLIILTILGLLLIPVIPGSLLFHVSFITLMNIAGAVGDLWVVGGLLFKRSPVFVQDNGDCVTMFQKSN